MDAGYQPIDSPDDSYPRSTTPQPPRTIAEFLSSIVHNPHRHRHHWWYVWIPVATAIMWFGTVLGLLITWLTSGRPHYTSMADGQRIAYISDVAADFLKPLFVVCCLITSVGFFLSLGIERWLRHEGRLLPNMRKREKVFSALAIFSSLVGGVGLSGLAIFDTKRFFHLHRVFLFVFILGVGLSGFFSVSEYFWLDKEFGADVHKLRRAYVLKAFISSTLVLLAITFGILLELDKKHDVAAGIEWTIAFGYTFYVATFWYDLRQSKGIGRGVLRPENLMKNVGFQVDRFVRRYGYERPDEPYKETAQVYDEKGEEYDEARG